MWPKSSHLSYGFLGAFLLSIAALQWWPARTYLGTGGQQPDFPVSLWILLSLILFWSALGCFHGRIRPAASMLLAGSLGSLVALLAVMRIAHVATPETIDFYATAQHVTVRGFIAEEPDRRPLQTKYTIEAQSLTLDTSEVLPVSGRVLATDPSGWPQYAYGAQVTATGILEKPGTIEGFHYDRYLSRYGIYSVMYRSALTKISDGAPNPLFAFLYDLKTDFEIQINRIFPEPHASLLAGILTGSRRGIPEHVLADFQATGLTHLVAISGFNITIVLSIISSLLFFLPLRWRFLPAVIAVIAFTLFVGAGASVVRASIMGILGLFALQMHRQTDVRLLTLWTAFFMLLWNPAYLWYDAGFQLSFLAVIGLTELGPLLEPLTRRLPTTLGLRESTQMTIAAQIAAVPLTILLFGMFSLIAPVANILVAPMVPLAMLFGFLGTLASFAWFPLGQLISFVAFGCLEWMLTVPRILARLPFATWDLELHRGFVALHYAILIIIAFWLRHRMLIAGQRRL